MTDNKNIKVAIKNISVFYSGKKALNKISMNIERNKITSLIGPSGCGKSTFLRCLNRMNDTIEGCKVMGEILVDGNNIYDPDVDVVSLRARIGMVFQKPNPFPKSIYDNVAMDQAFMVWQVIRKSWIKLLS